MSGSTQRLSERAALTWKHERPMKEAARLESRARSVQSVRRKLVGMFGADYEIRIGIDKDGCVTAEVDDLRFSTFIYNDDVITVTPVVKCPLCGRDAYLGAIEDLAELGEALEEYRLGLKHEC